MGRVWRWSSPSWCAVSACCVCKIHRGSSRVHIHTLPWVSSTGPRIPSIYIYIFEQSRCRCPREREYTQKWSTRHVRVEDERRRVCSPPSSPRHSRKTQSADQLSRGGARATTNPATDPRQQQQPQESGGRMDRRKLSWVSVTLTPVSLWFPAPRLDSMRRGVCHETPPEDRYARPFADLGRRSFLGGTFSLDGGSCCCHRTYRPFSDVTICVGANFPNGHHVLTRATRVSLEGGTGVSSGVL